MDNDFEKKIPRTAKEGFKKIEKNLSHAKKSIAALNGARTLNACIRGPNRSTNCAN